MFLALPSNSLPFVSKNDDAAKVRNFWVMACEVRFTICDLRLYHRPETEDRMVLIALRACRLSEAVKDPDYTPYLANRKSHLANWVILLPAGAFRGMGRRKRGEEGGDGRRAGAYRCRSLSPRRPSPPVPSGRPHHSAANAVSERNPLPVLADPWPQRTQ